MSPSTKGTTDACVDCGAGTHGFDRVTDGPKPELVRWLGANYHHEDIDAVTEKVDPDVVIEATGAGSLVFGAMRRNNSYGITCLTGVSPTGRRLNIDAGAINREIVLENDVVVGSVNANLRHYRQAADVLAHADAKWLAGLITRRVPLEKASEAFKAGQDDVKVIIELNGTR